VHYCGHADWSSTYPSLRGWAFKDGFLSAGDLEGMERPPRLVVANACESGRLAASALPPLATAAVAPGVAAPQEGPEVRRSDVGLVALLADEFFKRGIVDYIGTAWDVPSLPATQFAKAFYQAVLPARAPRDPVTIGEAVQRARQSLFRDRKRFGEYGSVWGAYQHYGDPTNTL